MNHYPKRLIEVDLPIKRISAHARREKSIRHGHISTLHIWWARRPLAACRAVLCAALWPDPADPNCPEAFAQAATEHMAHWCRHENARLHSIESHDHFVRVRTEPEFLEDRACLRNVLLDFIADFANWDNATHPDYLATAQALTVAAHEALGGIPGTRPLVVDPFAGGGSIPLEALRVGADAFASDLNPIPVLINKVQLEYIPKYGKQLAEEVRKWGTWMKEEAANELAQFYPSLSEPTLDTYVPQVPETVKRQGRVWKLKRIVAETPIAYLWARTVVCEGPGCGAEIPLMRSTYLAKKGSRSVGLRMVPNRTEKRVDIELVNEIRAADTNGSVKKGNAICPCCGFITPVASVRKQLQKRQGGGNDARLLTVVTTLKTERLNSGAKETFSEKGRYYRLPEKIDLESIEKVQQTLQENLRNGTIATVPDEKFTGIEPRRIPLPLYGINSFGEIFTVRQQYSLLFLCRLIHENSNSSELSKDLILAITTCLAFLIDKIAQYNSTLCRWKSSGENVVDTFGRQALPMVWDFAEVNIFGDASGDVGALLDWLCEMLDSNSGQFTAVSGSSVQSSAASHPMPDDSIDAFVTDPPYYYSVPYSDLSDFFYVWLKRSLGPLYPDLFTEQLTPKGEECVQNLAHSAVAHLQKDKQFYESKMLDCLTEGRRITKPNSVSVLVFAHTETSAWEALLTALISAGWYVTASWPIDTEMGTRLVAQRQVTLASSIHLVCRPRECADGTLIEDEVGDWRDVLRALPKRIHEWMPRLAAEGVVGADAIFACLGPALEIFSQYSRVEKPNGDVVPLREYLEQVWAAVSQEALNQVFAGGDAKGFEEDARLTAMWLWTLSASTSGPVTDEDSDEEGDEEDENNTPSKKKLSGFVLDYDTARKIAQGLGADLGKQDGLIEVKGDKARLLPVSERTRPLFGQAGLRAAPIRKKPVVQLALNFASATLESVAEPAVGYEMPELKVEETGKTVLDRLHQAMLLFDSGRTEALKRFLVEDGVGRDERFWKLAQALNALYPKDTPERRWVEAVQTFKKSLGL
ncbi:DUF1156 domain-containing protein [Rudanella paleaurantiibacter]|uniref:DUF1156 domain-containing protein n=1 Tax=Rudanella paleaurantiibacter TaxID=2614655 RepID=A0A7J5TT68_9BACT|nr:DUF1156 domain-containing protein [Rudanella paleaurantiibacter]KAB7726655.1 DUF1156 domain-containing protein [Rudanella paleaurantiibacter]